MRNRKLSHFRAIGLKARPKPYLNSLNERAVYEETAAGEEGDSSGFLLMLSGGTRIATL